MTMITQNQEWREEIKPVLANKKRGKEDPFRADGE
jgi:hypothetical protein